MSNSMKNKNNRVFVSLSLLLAVLLLFLLNALHYKEMQSTFDSVGVRIHSKGVTLKSIKNAIEDEAKKESDVEAFVTAYGIEEHKVIHEDMMERERTVTIYRVYGTMEQVLPMKLILGNYPYREDVDGCVMDKKTAYLLFGTYEVLGRKVTVDKKDYYIRGIVDHTIPVMLFQTENEEDIFWNLELSFPGEENGRMQAENYLMRHTLTNDYTIVEGNYIVRLTGNLVGLPLTLIFAVFLSGLIKQAWNDIRYTIKDVRKEKIKTKKVIKMVSWFLATGVTGYILVQNLERYFYFPKRFIPTRWSDFSHWSSIVKTLKEHFDEIVMLPPVKKDIVLLSGLTELIILTIITLFAVFLFLGYYLKMKTTSSSEK